MIRNQKGVMQTIAAVIMGVILLLLFFACTGQTMKNILILVGVIGGIIFFLVVLGLIFIKIMEKIFIK